MKIDQNILDRFIQDPNDSKNCFDLAEAYMELGQYTAAFTYYMKCAEACNEDDYSVKYHCLMSMSYIYSKLGNRWLGSMQYARFAKAECPDRPEAYYMIAKEKAAHLYYRGIYEQSEWIEVYENARIGCMFAKINDEPHSNYYPGIESLQAYYLIALLRLSKLNDLKEYLQEVRFTDLSSEIMDTLIYVYDQINWVNPYCTLSQFTYENLTDTVKKIIKLFGITNSYARQFEDIFHIVFNSTTACRSYLEFTDNPAININNSYLLEKCGWQGITIVSQRDRQNEYCENRKNMCLSLDNFNVNMPYILGKYQENTIGALILDANPIDISYGLLEKIDFTQYKFNTITFKHDSYYAGREWKMKAMNLLTKAGYVLFAEDVLCKPGAPYEDWYIREELLNNDIIEELYQKGNNNRFGYMLF